MSADAPEPETVWEQLPDEVASGMRVGVRAAVFQIGGSGRSAVTLSIAVPDAFGQPTDGGTSATILLNPNEANSLGAWLETAAGKALEAAPPMYE